MNDRTSAAGADGAPVGVGIIGAGRPSIATSNHIPACQRSGKVRIVALCDRLEGVREYAAQCDARAYTDYAAMLAAPDVEMVQIATPDWCHCDHTEQALAAGKHVLLQKPPCVSLDELERLRRAAANAPGRLKICLNNRERRHARTIRKCLDDGEIGELRHVNISSRGRRYPIRAPDSPYLKAEMGGVWIHNGLHWLDEAFFYAGALPTSVQVLAARNPAGAPEYLGEGPNYWSAFFEMGPQITFRFEYNTMLLPDGMPGGMQRCLIGTKGEIRQRYGDDALVVFRAGESEPSTPELLDADATAAEDSYEAFRRLFDAFVDEIRDGCERSPRVADSLLLMEALLRGARTTDSVALATVKDRRQ